MVNLQVKQLQEIPDDSRPEKIIRSVMNACADCDTCRFLMNESCLMFPELYRLYDLEKEGSRSVGENDLRHLVEYCTLCGLCPCPNIRNDLIRAKTGYINREGMSLSRRLLSDVQSLGRLCAIFPEVINGMLRLKPLENMAGKIADIHPQRRLPVFPKRSFFSWAKNRGLNQGNDNHNGPKAAYFAGCTAGYLFPEVARAAVSVLEHIGIAVYVPPQQCCGMPTMLEGDKPATLRRIEFNLEHLLHAMEMGYDLVCSCPTCGFFLKILLKERACYSGDYQKSVNAAEDEIIIPGKSVDRSTHISLKKSMYHRILKDDGYFSSLDPLKRMALADHVMDMGEYLSRLDIADSEKTDFGAISGRMVYHTPCHQREQQIGRPYEKLLSRIHGLTLTNIGSGMDCCGMGGSLGFKTGFSDLSLKLGRPLFRKIEAEASDAIITDCLSCRLQFEHVLPYPVYHPLEVLSRASGGIY